MGFGGFLWVLGHFYGVWGHPSHPLPEFGGFWGVLGSSHHLQVYATLVEVGFLVGLRSSWLPFSAAFWGVGGILWGFKGVSMDVGGILGVGGGGF